MSFTLFYSTKDLNNKATQVICLVMNSYLLSVADPVTNLADDVLMHLREAHIKAFIGGLSIE